MSLLYLGNEQETKILAQEIFDMQFDSDPKLEKEYDSRRKKLMFEDILYNLECLQVAVKYDEEKIFTDYAVWIYKLLCNLMGDLSKERIKEQMVDHYKKMSLCLKEVLTEEKWVQYNKHINNGIEATEKAFEGLISSELFSGTPYEEEKNQYLQLLLKSSTKEAHRYIKELFESGLDIHNIYVDIIQNVMYEVGELWHKNIITVDKEHYCSSVTQSILAQFYPIIFDMPRNGHTIVVCCVGSELHEMGARILSDIFEYNGWDSIYLGAAVPVQAIISAIAENKPEIVALSVTMPRHLIMLEEVISEIKRNFPGIKIAAGGRAFKLTDNLWKKLSIDIYTENAVQLENWARENIINGRKK